MLSRGIFSGCVQATSSSRPVSAASSRRPPRLKHEARLQKVPQGDDGREGQLAAGGALRGRWAVVRGAASVAARLGHAGEPRRDPSPKRHRLGAHTSFEVEQRGWRGKEPASLPTVSRNPASHCSTGYSTEWLILVDPACAVLQPQALLATGESTRGG